MLTDDSIWDGLVMAASVVWPGLLGLFLILFARSWLWRARFRKDSKNGGRKWGN